MNRLNENFSRLEGDYLFSEIARKVEAYRRAHPRADLIRLGIGDVTLPLAPTVIAALHRAVDEMARPETFRGYGPEQGYAFLREAIQQGEDAPRGVQLEPDEIFVSDGSKCDLGNLQELFSPRCRVAIADPVYPVYRDSNLMAGREVLLLPATRENHFAPELPTTPVDLLYLCSPNNPTGTALTREALQRYLDYAREHGTVILYDSAYSSYLRDPELPRSIYELDGAREVAIEFKSFSKAAGFTGLRCGFAVVPHALKVDGQSLNPRWFRRQCTKFNGVAYPVQRAAEAVYSETGRIEIAAQIAYYQENARLLREGLQAAGYEVYGGEQAPYLWWKLPTADSLAFFDRLLDKCGVIGTPGVGFGPHGEGYFRLTAFGDRERTREAVSRIAALG